MSGGALAATEIALCSAEVSSTSLTMNSLTLGVIASSNLDQD